MKFTEEFSADTFPFWSGAIETIKAIRKAKKMDEFQTYIEDYFANSTPTKTQINDFVWFGKDTIFEYLGIIEDQDD